MTDQALVRVAAETLAAVMGKTVVVEMEQEEAAALVEARVTACLK